MKKTFPLLISVFLGFTFWSSGMVKLFAGHQFIGWIGPPQLVEQLQDYQLGLFAEFIAICQITIGFMLLTTRFKLIGSIMMIPLIVNILMVTISQHWAGTPYVLAVLLLMDLYLLWQYRDFFWPLVDEGRNVEKISPRKSKSGQGHLTWLAGWALQLAAPLVSFQNLPLAFLTAGLGLSLAILSFRVDGIVLRKVATNP